MIKKLNSSARAMLLLGTFSMTQIRLVGSIGISEVFVFLIAPLWYMKDQVSLKRDGFTPLIVLSLLTCVSCLISSVLNHTGIPFVIRGIASPYAIFAWSVVLHHYLRQDLTSLRWLLLGAAITLIINTFVFQTGQGLDGSVNGEYGNAVEITMNNPLYWVSRITPWVTLPTRGWYFETPLLFSFWSALIFSVYTLFSSASGRSAAATLVASSFLLLIGGKSRQAMRRIMKNIVLVVICGMIGVVGFKAVYQQLAVRGMLGEKALKKYEVQTRQGTDILSLLMAGRTEFFIGFFAALDKPWFGLGPWAIDTNHYVGDYIAKYGVEEDYRLFLKNEGNMIHSGRGGMLLPTHSHVISYWVWYGMIGMILWLYVVFLCCRLFVKHLDAIPQWYGFFCLTVPASIWHIFFSPFGGRMMETLMIVTILISRAVERGAIQLPLKMQEEIYLQGKKR